MSEYALEAGTGCWVWQLSTKGWTGYGQKNIGGRMRLAHRVYYERYVGPIPEGKQLDHLCRNRLCVNPQHLEPVTNAENSRRGAKAKLTWEKVRAIRASSEPTAVLSERYGVSARHTRTVLNNQQWHDPEYISGRPNRGEIAA